MNHVANFDTNVNTTLRQVTTEVMKELTALAKERLTSVDNNVPVTIYLGERVYEVALVISGILDAVVKHAYEGKVNISAKHFHAGTVEFQVRDENCMDAYALAMSLQPTVALAKKAGGQLFITHQRKKITTVIFRFVQH